MLDGVPWIARLLGMSRVEEAEEAVWRARGCRGGAEGRETALPERAPSSAAESEGPREVQEGLEAQAVSGVG